MGDYAHRDCCCGECNNTVRCYECCRCLPEQLCVTVKNHQELCNDNGNGCYCDETTIHCNVQEDGSYIYQRSGAIVCGAVVSVDLTFTIERPNPEGPCYLYLESQCMGYTGEDRLREELVDGEGISDRQSCLDWSKEFEIDMSPCATGGSGAECTESTLIVKPVRVYSNPRSKECYGCGTCACLPKELCASYTQGETCFAASVLTWSVEDERWLGTIAPMDENSRVGVCEDDINIAVIPSRDLIGNCFFHVELTGGVVVTTAPVLVPLGMGCPERFDIDFSFDDAHLGLSVDFCGTCSTDTCCNAGLPDTLYATITDVGGTCSGLDGAVIELTWDGTNLEWSGLDGTLCDEGVEIALFCTIDDTCDSHQCSGWSISFTNFDAGCIDAGITRRVVNDSCTCDPPFFQITDIQLALSDCSCCTSDVSWELLITITD